MQPPPEDVPYLKMENISSLYSEKGHKKSPNNSSKESKDIENVPSSKFLIVPSKDGANAQDSLLANCSSKSSFLVGAFTIQCSRCLQWRRIPTQEKYEEIRESILQEPFYCENAIEWQPDASCSDPADISPERGGFWAIDKPNIPRSPPGWQRILKLRGEGGTRFADVYYVSPSGKRLRSKIEIERHLIENPEYERLGINSAKFSFKTPRPLQENYVRKKTPLSGRAHESGSSAY